MYRRFAIFGATEERGIEHVALGREANITGDEVGALGVGKSAFEPMVGVIVGGGQMGE